MLNYLQLVDRPMAAHRDMLGLAAACAYAGYGARASSADVPIDESPYDVIEGIARVPVCGMLMRRSSYGGSYAGVRAAVSHAVENPRVSGIVLDMDSMGGETSDLFSCADFLYSLRGRGKPVYSFCDPAFAGSYLLASCADRVYVSVTGGVGSVGCCAVHVDLSEADKQAGVKISFVSSGAKKLYGNPHEPLGDGARSELQVEVDRISRMMIDRVGRNRKIPARRITDTQAGCFFGEAATPLLADEVGSIDDVVCDLMGVCGINGRGQYSPIAREKRRLHRLRADTRIETDMERRKRRLLELREGR